MMVRGGGMSQFKWGSAPKKNTTWKVNKGKKRPKRDNKKVNEYKK